MNFLSKLTTPLRRAEKNFHRARAAELRADFSKAKSYFQTAAQAYDDHFTEKGEDKARPSQLVMAGITYVRIGRNEDALRVLNTCMALKEIPDAYLHAGYAAAKLGETTKAIDYWARYPKWYEQRIMHAVLKEQIQLLRESETPDLQSACEAIAAAFRKQDKKNESQKRFKRGNQEYPPNRGY